MCGIAGVFTSRRFVAYRDALPLMTGALAHRGPDACGHWSDPESGVALGHRRLSIIDLSDAGAQPMVSSSGRHVLTFNGEIYNHAEIRRRLEQQGQAPRWRGHSDTESLLAAVDAWGLEKALQSSTGMFAIALWDRRDRTLILARDRIGEKPLYYGMQDGAFLFGSELKAIRRAPCMRNEIDRDVLSLYFQYNTVPDPYCIYRGFRKLRAGCMLSIDAHCLESGILPEPAAYWSLVEASVSGLKEPFAGSDAEAIAAFEQLFARSIAEQHIADVPVGAFLSGGVDSSAVVAMMQAASTRKVKTFTIGFTEAGYDEAVYARAVARHLGTEHHELYVTSREAMDVIPKLPEIYCEPFADNSQIPTYLVSRLAREHVTVSLSGDAGDELFGGYGRYQLTHQAWQRLGRHPLLFRRIASKGLTSVPVDAWNRLIGFMRWSLPAGLKTYASGQRVHKFAEVLVMQDMREFYRRLVTHWPPGSIVKDAAPLPSMYSSRHGLPEALPGAAFLMAVDILGYLCSDILMKVDRAAMANSLETRVPLLDPRIVEFSQRLPLDFKIRDGVSKWMLRQILYRHVPKHLIERPKMGFGMPIGAWLRGPLRPWAEELLAETRLRESCFLDVPLVRRRWSEHLNGTHDWDYLLWDVLMFQAWLEKERNCAIHGN